MYIESWDIAYLGESERSLLFQSFGARFRLCRHVIFDSSLTTFCSWRFCRWFRVVLQHGFFEILAQSSLDDERIQRITIRWGRFTRTTFVRYDSLIHVQSLHRLIGRNRSHIVHVISFCRSDAGWDAIHLNIVVGYQQGKNLNGNENDSLTLRAAIGDFFGVVSTEIKPFIDFLLTG